MSPGRSLRTPCPAMGSRPEILRRSCMRGPIAGSAVRWEHQGMPLTTDKRNSRFVRPSVQDPSGELYNRACDVLAAAADLRAAAGSRSTTAGVASTLRCLEAALEQAAAATDLLREGSLERIEGAWPVLGDDASSTAARVSDGFDEAGDAIRAAGSACRDLRSAVGPLLAELTAL